MAKRAKRQALPGLFAVESMTVEELEQRTSKERELRKNLDWLRRTRDLIAKRWPDGFPSTDDPHEWCMFKIHEFATGLLDDSAPKKPFPEIVRIAWHLGILYQQLVSQKEFDGLVSKGRVSSKTAREKALKRGEKNLSDAEWKKVARYIQKRNATGIDISPACNEASRQLKTGVFKGISRRIDLGGDALRKRWSKLQK